MYVITAHQRHGRTDGRTSSDPMTATLLKHVAVKTVELAGAEKQHDHFCHCVSIFIGVNLSMR